jgi:hypothetical protein
MLKQILIFLFIIISFSSYSQQFEGGFFAGVSASQIDGDNFAGYNKGGLTAGAYITREITRNIKWKTEIRYIMKGSYQKYTEENPVYYKTTLHYAEIPVLAQYFFKGKTFFEFGLLPEVLLSSKEEDEGGIIPTDQTLPFHRFSLEATAGMGYFLTKNIAAGFRFNYSVLTCRDHASGQTYYANRGQYNNVLSFSVYYHFK